MTNTSGAGLSVLPCLLGWVLGAGTLGWGSLLVPVPQAQWDCVNLKYTQEKRSPKNSGVVILADLKVSLGPACSPSPRSGWKGCSCLSSAESDPGPWLESADLALVVASISPLIPLGGAARLWGHSGLPLSLLGLGPLILAEQGGCGWMLGACRGTHFPAPPPEVCPHPSFCPMEKPCPSLLTLPGTLTAVVPGLR